jgi:hypothetical protein
MEQRPGSTGDDAWQPHEPGGPAPAPAGAPRRRRLLAGAALATGLAVGGAGVAAAVTSGDDVLQTTDAQRGGPQNGFFGPGPDARETPSAPGSGSPGEQGRTQPGPGSDGLRGPGGWHHGHGRRGGFGGGGLGGALHGKLVVPQEDGTGTRTITVQSGTVTSVSSTRLAVKSTDGFTATYVVNSSTRLTGGQSVSAVKTGHVVAVVASKSGSTLTALRIGDRNLRPQWSDRDRRDRTTPSPSQSPSSSPSNASDRTA